MIPKKSLTKKSLVNVWKARKSNKYRGEQAGEGWVTSLQYNTSSSTCIPNMTTLACTVLQKSLMKGFPYSKYGSMERKQTDICREGGGCFAIPQFNTSATCIYGYSSLHGFTEIFDEDFVVQSMERKKIGQIQARISRRRFAIPRSMSSLICIINMTTLACTVVEKSLTKI